MATIGTAIRLNDMMSAPLRHIIDAMDGMLSTWNELESSTRNGLNVNGMESVRANIKLATKGLDDMEEEQRNFNKQVQNGTKVMDGLTDKIIGAVGAFVGMQGIQELVNLSDTYTQTQARLAMIVDEQSNVNELNDKIFASAQRARANYQSMSDTIAKLSLQAGDAFGSNDETILFAENLNKLFTIAGTEQASVASATLQLTQALGSGVLRGEEFNAVFEAAPNIMQTVADYIDVPIGKLRSMAQDGQITADIVKNALISATDEINSRFETMPMTWAQVWTEVMNSLYYASVPLLEAINWMAQNWSILEPIVLGVATAIGIYTAALLIHNGVQAITNLMKSVHAASTMMEAGATFTATAAQHGFNAALLACPLTWILLIIIAVVVAIYAVVAAINKVTGKTISATGIIVGAVMSAVAFIYNLFLGLLDLVLAVINYMVNPWIAFANFFGNLFNDPIGSIIHLFGDFADNILGVIESIAKAIDKVFGSNLANAVQGWRSGLDDMVEIAANKHGNGSYEKVANELNLSSESLGLSRWAYSDAWDFGYDLGADVEDSVSNMFGGGFGDEFSMDNLTQGIGDIPTFKDIADNTGDTANALDITNENLKYLRDLAEQDAVNRFTTAEVRVEMTNNNNISSDLDLDGVMDYMVTGVQEAMERVAEGVHG